MAEKTRCEICDRTFKDLNGLEMHNRIKHPKSVKREEKLINVNKIKGWSILIVLVAIVAGIYWIVSSGETLPPTDMAGHIEASPPSHVMREPMNILIHKHMLEHVDGIGGARVGAIINYNCVNYDCEQGLIENLEDFAGKYNHVYVAPFKNMGAKIALTKLNRQKLLDDYDEEQIDEFIR